MATKWKDDNTMSDTINKFGQEFIDRILKDLDGRLCYEDSNCNYLAWVIAQSGDGDHLEIGTLHGGSAILVALIKKTNDFSGKVWCIDPLDGYYKGTKYEYPVDLVSKIPVTRERVLENAKKFGVRDRIKVIASKSVPLPRGLPKRFASAFIDGDHSGDVPLQDWHNVKDRTDKYVIFDNANQATNPDVMVAVREAANDPDWELIWSQGITVILILQRDFILLRDFGYYYETLRFRLMDEPLGREEFAMRARSKHTNRRVRRTPPASGRKPVQRISARDVSMTADELQAFHREFQPLFQRREQRVWSLLYLCGQLSDLERKTIEPMVLSLLGAKPNAIRGLQQFIGQGEWESEPLLLHLQELVSRWLGEEDGVVIVDGSGFPKQGKHSVGVAHQYCGVLGKIANCQEGVFLVYASRRGYTFVDERLYMPEEWFRADARQRWKACGIPDRLGFCSEPELGLEMITALHQRGVLPFRWVTCDEKYGRNPAFLAGIATLGKWYLAEVPVDTRVWLRTPAIEPPGPGLLGRPRLYSRVKPNAPRPLELRELLLQLPRGAWHRRKIQEGSKGPLVVELACVRVTPIRDAMPAPRCWAIFRRSLGAQPETKYYLCNAPANLPPTELAPLTAMRWPVETTFEEAKGEVGLDHFETRTWQGWHHHMIQSFLAHLFLMHIRLLFQKKALHSPRPRLGSSWHVQSATKLSASPISPPFCTTVNLATMRPTALMPSVPVHACKNEPRIIAKAKSRSNNRSLVVI
jgi:SRSO17 transposase